MVLRALSTAETNDTATFNETSSNNVTVVEQSLSVAEPISAFFVIVTTVMVILTFLILFCVYPILSRNRRRTHAGSPISTTTHSEVATRSPYRQPMTPAQRQQLIQQHMKVRTWQEEEQQHDKQQSEGTKQLDTARENVPSETEETSSDTSLPTTDSTTAVKVKDEPEEEEVSDVESPRIKDGGSTTVKTASLSSTDPKSTSNSNEENWDADVCAICLGVFTNGDMVCESTNTFGKCFHLYHQTCMSSWLLQHVECPICRETYLQMDYCHAVNKAREDEEVGE